MFAYILAIWSVTAVLQVYSAYISFGKLTKQGIKLMMIVFSMLNNIDLVKDLQYLIFRKHTAIYTLIFCATIVVPIFVTIFKTKMLILAMRDDEGRPKVIKEFQFIFSAIK